MGEDVLIVKAYLDVILLINFFMNFFVLWVTGKIMNLPIKLIRLMLGAVLGALYSLVIFLPEWPMLSSFLLKNICAVIMVWVALRPRSIVKFVSTLIYMYILSFAIGGAIFAVVFLTGMAYEYVQVWNGIVVLKGLSYGWLAIGLGVALFLGYGGFHWLRKNWLQHQLLNSLTICFQKKEIVVPALLDTGNQLIDPFTKKPVIVVECKVLEKILPSNIYRKISEENPESSELYASLDQHWISRLFLIPYNSVGKSHGLMIGLRPDRVVIKNGREEIITSNVVLGLVNKSLSQEGRYRALLHPQVLQEH